MVAPARGATMLKKQIIPIVRAFQSALPRGERQQIGGSPDEDRNISIHAPTRGATSWRRSPQSNIRYFNPRSHEGSDLKSLKLSVHCFGFQSTLPRGERPAMVVANSFTFKFQSTLPRGERLDPFTGAHALTDFNPRSHEGSDHRLRKPLRW